MLTFAELGLSKKTLKSVSEAGYDQPTPIQAKAIPTILAGHDVLGIAQTGTGKTAAFVLPLIEMLSKDRERAHPKTAHALILAPTRELAGQIHKTVVSLIKKTPLRATLVTGGMRMNAQIGALSGGLDIIIATPGRLEDHMKRGSVSLDATRYVVLDEADHMLDIGFLPAIKRIHEALAEDRQTLMFTATMPKAVKTLAQTLLNAPRDVAVAAQSKPVDRIEQRIVKVESRAKSAALLEICETENIDRAVVFARTKRAADRIARNLSDAGHSADAIHGDRNQGQRNRALNGFRSGKIKILVATDIAARGIDIPGVSHVINYDLPTIAESYVHRIGRTARAGESGIAIALMDPSERDLLRDIEKLTGLTLLDDERGPGAKNDTGPAAKRPTGRGGQGKGRSGNRSHARPNGRPKNHSEERSSGRAEGRPARFGKKPTQRKAKGNTGGTAPAARKGRRSNAARKPAQQAAN